MMGYDSCYGFGGVLDGGWMAGGWLGLLVIATLAALVVGIALAMRHRGRSTADPREIQRLRLARGEISAEEFEQASRAIGG